MNKVHTIIGIERREHHSPVTMKRAEDDNSQAIIEGYAALYNTEANIGNWFREIIMPGAFDECLNDDVRCLFNHNPNYILARSVNGSGTLTLTLDSNGLKYSFVEPNRSYAKDLSDAINSGDVTGSSFSWDSCDDVWEYPANELPLRKIYKMRKLMDVSPVTFPAYEDTSVAKRSHDAFIQEIEAKPEIVSNSRALNIQDAQYMFNINKSK